MRHLKLPILTLAVALSSHAAGPTLTDLEPRGAQRGKAFTLTLSGTGLTEEIAVLSSLPASFTPLAPKAGRMGEPALSFLVELRADTPVGLYPIRVRNPEGLSNLMLFSVGLFPEQAEEESGAATQEYSNDAAEKAQVIEVPATINGRLRGPDQDFYRFRARAGERLVFEVEARRAGSAVDPLIRVLEATGREMARNDDAPGLGVDARLEVPFPGDGDYLVAVQDSKFSAQAQNFYRLKIGKFVYADGIFPLGWKRGEPVEVELFGGNLPAPVKVRPETAGLGPHAGFTRIALPGQSASLPFPFALSDRPEAFEPAAAEPPPLKPGTTVNGRIARASEVDRYRLAVNGGEQWLVEMENAALGTSRLYGVVTIYDAAGKKLASAGDTGKDPDLSFLISVGDNAVDPYVAFQAPPGMTEVVVAVEDLLGRGGPDYGYRLLARQQSPDFSLSLSSPFVNVPLQGSVAVSVTAVRRGYMGPIRLSIPDLPEDLLVEGGNIPGETGGQTRQRSSRTGILTITPKPGAKTRTLDLAVLGEGRSEDGRLIRRRAAGPGMVTAVRGANQKAFQAPWLDLALPAMVVKEQPASLEVVSPRYVRLVQGMESQVEWKFARRVPGIKPPARVNGDNVPGVGNLRVVRGKSGAGGESGSLTLVTTVGTPPMKFDMLVDATITIDGRDERITAPAVTFEVVQGFRVEAPASLSIAAGGQAELAGRIQWEPAFSAPVTIKAENLPLQVSCRTAEAPPKTEEFRLACQASPMAAAGEYEIELNASSVLAGRDKESVPYTIPPIKTRLVVSGE